MRFYVSDTVLQYTIQRTVYDSTSNSSLGHLHAVTDELFYDVVSIPLPHGFRFR